MFRGCKNPLNVVKSHFLKSTIFLDILKQRCYINVSKQKSKVLMECEFGLCINNKDI